MSSLNAVLSEAGGGHMGIGPARYLAETEALVGVSNIAHLFALLIGTSVGAIDMALLACGYNAQDVLDLHTKHGAKIFGDKLWAYRLLKKGPKYSDIYVLKLLREKFGTVTLGQTATPLYIPAYDARRRKLKVFGPKDTLVPVWYAVRCSMAASTYFAPMGGYSVEGGVFRVQSEKRYIDGGFAANDPLLCGIAAGFEDGILRTDDLRLLELVTSGETPESGPLETGWNVLTALTKVIIPAVTAGNSADVEFIGRAWLRSLDQSPDNLFRVNPATPDMELDETKKSHMVEELWVKQWDKDYGRLLRFLGIKSCT
jgi:hypothetical protein